MFKHNESVRSQDNGDVVIAAARKITHELRSNGVEYIRRWTKYNSNTGYKAVRFWISIKHNADSAGAIGRIMQKSKLLDICDDKQLLPKGTYVKSGRANKPVFHQYSDYVSIVFSDATIEELKQYIGQ